MIFTERERNTFQNKNKVVWLHYLYADHEKWATNSGEKHSRVIMQKPSVHSHTARDLNQLKHHITSL